MNDKLRDVFYEGAVETLGELEAALLRLGEDSPLTEEIDSIFRSVHTLKGSAGMLGFDDISTFSHRLESEFDAIRTGRALMTEEMVRLSLRACDHIRALVEARFDGPPVDARETPGILEAIGVCMEKSLVKTGNRVNPAFSLLRKWHSALAGLEKSPNEPALIDKATQCLVELREAASTIHSESLGEFLKPAETLILDARAGSILLSDRALSLLHDASREAEKMLMEGEAPAGSGEFDPEKIMEDLQAPLRISGALNEIHVDLLQRSAKPVIAPEFKTFRIRISIPPDVEALGFDREFFLHKLRGGKDCEIVSVSPSLEKENQDHLS
jgi:chemotaxis protein histidine kinase CheA